MIASQLVEVRDDGAALVDIVAPRPIVRIDVEGVKLGAGEFVEFRVTLKPPDAHDDRLPVVGSDPPEEASPLQIIGNDPPEEMSFSLPIRAKRGERITITVAKGRKDQRFWSRARFIVVFETTRWIDHLPAAFRQDHAQADFLGRFLGALFVDGERIESKLDHCLEFIAPRRLPSLAAARFLAGWFNIDLDSVLPPKVAVKKSRRKDEEKYRLAIARTFLTRVLPHALGGGTVASTLGWIDAVAEARRMKPERRKRIALVEGFKMRRLFTLPAEHRQGEPDPTELRLDWGWLAKSAPLANDPLAHRAFLDRSRLDGAATLGMPNEDRDPILLYRLLGGQLWLFVPKPKASEPKIEDWPLLLAPILPAHLVLNVVEEKPRPLGQNSVLGLSTVLMKNRVTTA